jgi:hypothetical protein
MTEQGPVTEQLTTQITIEDEKVAQVLQSLLNANTTTVEVYDRRYYDDDYIPYEFDPDYFYERLIEETREEKLEAFICMNDKSNPRWRECWHRYYALQEYLERIEESYEEYMRKKIDVAGCGEIDKEWVEYYDDGDGCYCEEEDEYCYRESVWDGEEIYVIPGNILIDVEKRYEDVAVSVSAIDRGDVLTIRREQGKWLVEIAGRTVESPVNVLIDIRGRIVSLNEILRKICNLVEESTSLGFC